MPAVHPKAGLGLEMPVRLDDLVKPGIGGGEILVVLQSMDSESHMNRRNNPLYPYRKLWETGHLHL